MRRRDFIGGVVAAGALPLVGCVARPLAGPAPHTGWRERLDTGWRFTRGDVAGAQLPDFDDGAWERATLPHTARVEALVTGPPGSPTYQWQGTCWYRRRLRITDAMAGRKIFLKFDGAMNVAEVWLDGVYLGRHMGGWLPFVFDIGERVTPTDAVLAVRLDNTDNPITGPKPLAILDFNTYGGLYRHVWLTVKDRLHITDPILAGRPAGGGVFVTYPEANAQRAVVNVKTHVQNDHAAARTFAVRASLLDGETVVAVATSPPATIRAGASLDVGQNLEVASPRLWSPRDPHLYTVRTEVVSDGGVTDAEETRAGIRRIEIDRAGFRINGERMFLRGTNRHQEYPYVGYALSDAAQHRDARHIKDAGFDYIRLSHYPHAPAFMDACDELGLVVMNCIPGWQYFGEDPAFEALQYENSRQLVRRDRNHACVILWEVSLNETWMQPPFIERTHALAHEEYPGDQLYTCGWQRGYDVFIRARQHGSCHGVEDVPCVVSEYGDWEYYAMTAGLNQEDFEALAPGESNSRQLRWHGERALLQQATNFQEAHDDNRSTPAFADGLWVMFDYNRGYAPDIESSGCMDSFRLPKYARWFFRSQRDAGEALARAESGAMVFIASEWTPDSATEVRVFSNCDEVELRLNGALVERRRPDADRISRRLAHPPFTFGVGAYAPGTLEAVGYSAGRAAARAALRSPGAVARLHVAVNRAGRDVATAGKDVLLVHAALEDAHGTVVAGAWENVAFGATGEAALVGTNPFSSDAGIASIVVETPPRAAAAAVYALAVVRDGRGARILDGAAGLLGEPARYEVRFTTDGTPAGPASPRYAGPVAAARVRAALVAEGRVLAELDEAAPKFRIPGSTPPETREPFRHHSP